MLIQNTRQTRLGHIVLRCIFAVRIRVTGGTIIVGLLLHRLGIDQALNLAETTGTRLFPALVCTPAEVACARQDTVGMETGILVERDEMGGMRRTKDVTTMATMMTTQEETKGGATGRGIAVGRSRVGLKECPSAWIARICCVFASAA